MPRGGLLSAELGKRNAQDVSLITKPVPIGLRNRELLAGFTYQVLTKRADRMKEMLAGRLTFAAQDAHIWWGVSVEDKRFGLPRLNTLRQTPAAMRFLSIEPLLEDLGEINLEGIDWAIVGGESGTGARPMDKAWVTSLRRQCRAANVPFFFKQWGGVRKSEAGRTLDGRTYDEMPKMQRVPSLPHRERMELIREVSEWESLQSA